MAALRVLVWVMRSLDAGGSTARVNRRPTIIQGVRED